MQDTAPEPLWQSVVGEREPWRRGRTMLIVIAIVTAAMQLFNVAILVLGGYIEQLFILAATVAVSWLGFYFIWTGVHWVRWLLGAWLALTGFAFCIWSIEAESGPLFLNGLYLFSTGCYLALAPSIYFFAQRQHERRDWQIALLVGAVFVLVVVSLCTGIYGLGICRRQMQSEARFYRRCFQPHFRAARHLLFA